MNGAARCRCSRRQPDETDSPRTAGGLGLQLIRASGLKVVEESERSLMAKFWLDEFWSSAVLLTEVVVPAKRVRYRVEPSGVVAEAWASQGVKDFERMFREFFGGPKADPRWPFRGRLLVAISVSLPETEVETKDVDNIAKSILDACKGVVFESDAQVHALFVQKKAARARPMAMIGLRLLPEGESTWYMPLFGKVALTKTAAGMAPTTGALDPIDGALIDEDQGSEGAG
jgi:Holliday junction resolvase RusA-like endonuclease